MREFGAVGEHELDCCTCVTEGEPSWGVLFRSCGPCLSDMGRFEFFMGRFGFGHGAIWFWSWGDFLQEVRPDAADGAAGEDAADGTSDERPNGLQRRFEHSRPVDFKFHLVCSFLWLFFNHGIHGLVFVCFVYFVVSFSFGFCKNRNLGYSH